MNGTGRMFWSLVWLATAVAASPTAGGAEPDAGATNSTLYEVTETLNARGGKLVRRVAVAALSGTVDRGTSLCPAELAAALSAPKCSITAVAHDNILLSTGQGPVSGTFAIVVQDNNTVDGPELVIVRGTLNGRIDLSPAVLGGVPLGTITGTWSATAVRGGPMHGFRGKGTLDGMFRLPFDIPGVGASYLLDPRTFPAPGSFVAVRSGEKSLDVPTVRLELTFTDTP